MRDQQHHGQVNPIAPRFHVVCPLTEKLPCSPLLDLEGDHTHHGGNFQATSVAQAMEKTRLALYMLGKLAFAQTTEIINCQMNKGLPSCLAGDEPSTNYQ